MSFTNKQSAYYYTQTHQNCHPEHAWFRGLNIAGRRIFNDYHLSVDGAALDPAIARVVACPDALVRTYPNGVTETLRLFDNRDLVAVNLIGASGKVDLRPLGMRGVSCRLLLAVFGTSLHDLRNLPIRSIFTSMA